MSTPKNKKSSKGHNIEEYKGHLILILGPSGTGKGTIINHLKENFPDLVFPVSCTTRAMRPNEIAGDVYNFISKEEFLQKIDNNEFLEWAIVHGDNYYGTDKSTILDNLQKGNNILREVDIQGVLSLLEIIPKENISTIFITTDSWEELANRISKRAAISDEELEKRKQSYHQEIQHSKDMDFILFSEDGKIAENNKEAEAIVKKILAK